MISVLMCIYNEKIIWIQEAINSILSQTYQDFEFIIVVDNPKLARESIFYLDSLAQSDPRIKIYYNGSNQGLAKSLNRGLSYASGEYIARMDADDISMPNRFQKELDYLIVNNKDMVSCQRINMDENGEILNNVRHLSTDPNKELPFSNFIVHPGVMIKSNIIHALGGYRNFHKSQDYDLWLRMISSGYCIGVLDDYLIKYRIRKNSISGRNRLEQYYISEYQKLLYWERLKTGKDSFSEENLKGYIASKKITPQKNMRYILSKENMNLAINKFKGKNVTFLFYILKAFIIYPIIPIKSIQTILKMKRAISK